MQPPRKPCHPSAWQKVEAVCCALFFVASANNRARHSGTVKKTKPLVWQCAKAKPFGKIFIGWFCFCPQPRLKIFLVFVFHTALHACHACCRFGRFDFVFFPAGLLSKPHTNKKCMHGLMAALLFCGGKAVAAMPLFRARLFPRRLPPHPRTPARARAYARVG
jgi:hypothetical protein